MISAGWYNTTNKDARMVEAIGRMTNTQWRRIDMTSISGIYKITNNINGHVYVGSACNLGSRRSRHFGDLSKNKHRNSHLQNAYNKYGAGAFDFSVIEYCDKYLLIEREQFFLDTLRPEYNIAQKAGSLLGTKRTPEQNARNSALRTGIKLTLEHCAKISAALLGKKRTPPTDTARKNMSIAANGNKNGLGKYPTAEHRAKNSVAQLGNKNALEKHTDETKQKMSIAKKKWWAERKSKNND